MQAYVEQARRQTEIERMATEKEKTGVFLGSHLINRLTGEEVPIFIADYALMGYGTGAVMGSPPTTRGTSSSPRSTDFK